MTYKQIDSSREVRLWIGQIIVPVVTTAVTIIMVNPEVQQAVTSKCNSIKDSIKNKFRRKKGDENSNTKYYEI